MLTISGKALGRKKPLFADWSVAPPAELLGEQAGQSQGAGVSLRRLIEYVVRIEVDAFRQRQSERRLLRVLTEREIQEGLALGKIDMGGREADTQPADANAAVDTAWQAFADGIYLVAVDGREYRSLDELIPLTADSRLTFIRLTLLAGG